MKIDLKNLPTPMSILYRTVAHDGKSDKWNMVEPDGTVSSSYSPSNGINLSGYKAGVVLMLFPMVEPVEGELPAPVFDLPKPEPEPVPAPTPEPAAPTQKARGGVNIDRMRADKRRLSQDSTPEPKIRRRKKA